MDIGGPFTKINWQKINLNSFSQVKDYLLYCGWKPTEWTEAGSPKLTEDSFDSIDGDIPKLLTRRAILIHRKRMLDNVKKNGEEGGLLSFVRDDGRIEARAITNGTNTGRMRHSQIVNIPSLGSVYGEEFRSLFITPEGYVILGIDAAALEARCQAHYVMKYKGGEELADLLINGDIHQANADMWGCSRKEAKSPLYCLMYGGQPQKLADTMGCSLNQAKKHYKLFWDTYAPLTSLKNDLIKVWELRGGKNKGFLKGLDGRKLFARSPHSLVNMMFQSAGSILVKTAACFMDGSIKKNNFDCTQIIIYHDEMAYEVKEEQAELAKELAEKAFEMAGIYHKFNVPLVGVGKIGTSWRDCH